MQRRRIKRRIVALAFLVSLAGCGPAIDIVESPAATGSAQPRLSVGPSGSVVLSWLEHTDAEAVLRYSVYRDNRWSDAGTVARGSDWFVNWADFPSVVPLGPDLWAAHWLVKRPGGTYSYDVAISVSTDAGGTWSEPIIAHDDGTATEHGFVSLFPWRLGVGALYLDGRNMVGDMSGHQHATGDRAGEGMTLRSALISREGTLEDSRRVDDLVCDCCQTAAAMTETGPVAVYRDRTPEEIRDIHVTRMVANRWSEGRPVTEDNWNIAGCPVNGPAIDARGRDVVVAWFTAAEDVATVRFARSGDSGKTFSPAIDIGTRRPIGRADVVLLPGHDAIVMWMRHSQDEQAQIVIRRVSRSGDLGRVRVVAASSGLRSAGFPQMALSGNDLVFAWTDETGDRSVVVTAIAQF